MTHLETLSKQSPETTDLERRVLAHERVLQALIAYMSRTEPHFVNHLRERFVEPMSMAQHEHDYRDSDEYAEEFIRAVMLMGEARTPKPANPKLPIEQNRSQRERGPSGRSAQRPAPPDRDRVEVKERDGIWEIKVDGAFRGDYHKEEHALAAAAFLKLSIPMPDGVETAVLTEKAVQIAENEGMPVKPDGAVTKNASH
jgi:hypothetical protein